MTAQTPPDAETSFAETRFTSGAWLTLAIALLWLTLMPASLFLSYSYPSDGWRISVPTLILDSNLSDTPSPLRAGDDVVAVNGQPIRLEYLPRLPLDWQEGQVWRYTVVRDGQILDVDVTLKRLSPSAYFRTLANGRESWAFAVSVLLSLLVAAFAFFRRPGNTAARYLLLIFSCTFGVAMFSVHNTLYIYSYPLLLSFWKMYYMVMEFIAGKDLAHLMKETGAMPLAQALPFLRDVASALDYAHTQGLVHRDVKPSNVMLDPVAQIGNLRYRAVLTDFGIVRFTGGAGMTKTALMGTLDYMAPEQIRSAGDMDGRADVYALGAMVYQMLTGQLPFHSDNAGAVLIAHLQQPAPDPRALAPGLPAEAAQAIQHALAKQPEDRFQTAGEFVAALGR